MYDLLVHRAKERNTTGNCALYIVCSQHGSQPLVTQMYTNEQAFVLRVAKHRCAQRGGVQRQTRGARAGHSIKGRPQLLLLEHTLLQERPPWSCIILW